MTYADKLRALATYLDEHPELRDKQDGEFDYPSFAVYADDWDEFQELIKNIGGFEKAGSYGNLSATHTEKYAFGGFGRVFRVYIYVQGACERVEKLDETGRVVMRKVTKTVETGELEPEYEWKCPESWLS